MYFLHLYSTYICRNTYLEYIFAIFKRICRIYMLLCIFVKTQGSNLFSSNGRVKIFSAESRIIFV